MLSHHVMIPLLEKKKKKPNQIKLKQSPCFRSSVWFRTNVSCKKQVGWVEGGLMSPAGSGCAHFSWMRTSLILWRVGYTIWATSIYGLALQFMLYEFLPRQSCSVWLIGVLSGEQSRRYESEAQMPRQLSGRGFVLWSSECTWQNKRK